MSILDRPADLCAEGDRSPVAARSADASLGWVAIAGGGTAGHLYPALAVMRALEAAHPGTHFQFFGTPRAIDEQVLRAAGQEVHAQAVQPLSLRPSRMMRFWRGWRQAVDGCEAWFAQHRPSLVLGTGGYASAPAVRVASRRGVPVALLNPDCIPGRANRLLARWADLVFVQWPQTRRAFGRAGRRLVVSGCPVRSAFREACREDGVRHFELAAERRTLLVTGASLGSSNLNAAMSRMAPRLADLSNWQVLHLAGSEECSAVAAAYRAAGVTARCVAYTEAMPAALAAADLVVGRSGASTVAELTAVGRASILLPYPYHRDQHQRVNAEVLAARGAAMVCDDRCDGSATAALLERMLLPLMIDDARREQMARAALAMGRPRAAERVADACAAYVRAGGRDGWRDGLQVGRNESDEGMKGMRRARR